MSSEQPTIAVQRLSPADLNRLIELIRLYERAFEMKDFMLPGQPYLQSLLERPDVSFLVALIDNQVVGGLTAYDLPSVYSAANEVYLYDLAVVPEWQRRGVGRLLLAALGDCCRQRGDVEFFVQAEADDTGAIEFYRAVGGSGEEVLHFSFPTTEVRCKTSMSQ
jgi:aminoglycoside 3-N-acetyltransferase I